MRLRHHVGIIVAFAMALCEAASQDVILTNAMYSGNQLLLEWTPPTNRFVIEQATTLTDQFQIVASSSNTVANSIHVGTNLAATGFFRLRHGLEVVVIQDTNFLAGLVAAVPFKHEPTNYLFDIDLAGITNLFEDHGGITNISGIEYCSSLAHVDLFENDIRDVGPMSNLTSILTIELGYNHTTNLSPLAGLTNLFYLGITQNGITDISFVSGLISLRELYAAYNPIADLGPLGALTNLEVLALANCVTTNLAPVGSLTQLREIYILESSFSDISSLAALTNLYRAHLSGNEITDLQALVDNAAAGGLGSGDQLELNDNPLNDYAITNQIPILRDVYGIDVSI